MVNGYPGGENNTWNKEKGSRDRITVDEQRLKMVVLEVRAAPLGQGHPLRSGPSKQRSGPPK